MNKVNGEPENKNEEDDKQSQNKNRIYVNLDIDDDKIQSLIGERNMPLIEIESA
jgi:hypothetical protein